MHLVPPSPAYARSRWPRWPLAPEIPRSRWSRNGQHKARPTSRVWQIGLLGDRKERKKVELSGCEALGDSSQGNDWSSKCKASKLDVKTAATLFANVAPQGHLRRPQVKAQDRPCLRGDLTPAVGWSLPNALSFGARTAVVEFVLLDIAWLSSHDVVLSSASTLDDTALSQFLPLVLRTCHARDLFP